MNVMLQQNESEYKEGDKNINIMSQVFYSSIAYLSSSEFSSMKKLLFTHFLKRLIMVIISMQN